MTCAILSRSLRQRQSKDRGQKLCRRQRAGLAVQAYPQVNATDLKTDKAGDRTVVFMAIVGEIDSSFWSTEM